MEIRVFGLSAILTGYNKFHKAFALFRSVVEELFEIADLSR